MTDWLMAELADRIAAKKVIIVVGTGVSLASTGGNKLASWTGLIANELLTGAPRGVAQADIDTLLVGARASVLKEGSRADAIADAISFVAQLCCASSFRPDGHRRAIP
jgi:hypothetical protein